MKASQISITSLEANPYKNIPYKSFKNIVNASTGRCFQVITYEIAHDKKWRFVKGVQALVMSLLKGIAALCSKNIRNELKTRWFQAIQGLEIKEVHIDILPPQTPQKAKASAPVEFLSPDPLEFSQELLDQALKDPLLNPQTFLEILQSDPYLKTLYLNTQENTDQILASAEKLKTRLDFIDLSWNEYTLFLILYSLGRGIELPEEDIKSPIQVINEQFANTRELILQVVEQSSLKPEKIELLLSLLKYDTQKLYLNEIISIDEAFDHIVELADEVDVEPLAFYQLLEITQNILDTAENLETKEIEFSNRQTKIDALTQMLYDAELGGNVFAQLKGCIQTSNSEKAREICQQNVKYLLSFLKKMHKKMLFQSENQMNENKETFRDIKRTFRDLFLLLAKDVKDLEKLKHTYAWDTSHELGRRDYGTIIGGAYDDNFIFIEGVYPKKYNETILLKQFYDELKNFRKNYLCRYSLDKVKDVVVKELEKLNNEEARDSDEEDNFVIDKEKVNIEGTGFQLLQTTFVHGSNSAILANLHRTNFHLLSSGRLIHEKIIPFSGELQEGSSKRGVNAYNISGTSLDHAELAQRYALKKEFHFNLQNEQATIADFIEEINQRKAKGEIFKNNNDTMMWDHWTRLSISLQRIRATTPQFFESHKNELNVLLDEIEVSFNKFKFSEEYKSKMPKTEDPTGKLGYRYHDYYYYDHYMNMEGAIQSLKKAMRDDIRLQENLNLAEQPFPVVFSSRTIHTEPLQLNCPSERVSPKASKLGKDIQYIFTDTIENMEKLQNYLESNAIDNVALYTFQELKNAIDINKLASEYFADFASMKKLALL